MACNKKFKASFELGENNYSFQSVDQLKKFFKFVKYLRIIK